MSKINLKIGGRYTARNGATVVIVSAGNLKGYPFRADTGRQYTPDGRWLSSERESVFDLVAVIAEPAQGNTPQGEADPNGVAANAPGSKLDAGKLLPRLVLGEFARALEQVVVIGTAGARKYTPRGWLTVENGRERYAEAADRHQLAVNKGLVWDTDDGTETGDRTKGGTGGRHKAQVIWNLLAELELELRNA